MKLLIFLLSVALASSTWDDLEDLWSEPVVRVRIGLGELEGRWEQADNGRNFAKFEGIPYGKPPVGDNKFKPAEPAEPWTGVWHANVSTIECLQYNPFLKKVVGQEDCLRLNVYTTHDQKALQPVVVFIHGGGFFYGSGGVYNPYLLMNKDLVIVTINYRVGPIGFLSTGDEVMPGNIGLKDQTLALKWIQEHIHHFGGDPKNVILTGHSAGSACVNYHYLSTLSRGLFAKGMALSGSALAPWAYAPNPAEKAKELASIVGCPTTTSQEMVDCLTEKPGAEIVNATAAMFDWKRVTLFSPFLPTTEPVSEGAFLAQHPYAAMAAGAIAQLPLVTSITSEEGLYPAAMYQSDPDILPELESKWDELAKDIFIFKDTLPADLHSNVSAKIKQQYMSGKPVSQDTFAHLVQALSDRLFVSNIAKMTSLVAEGSSQPVYMYRYCFHGLKSFTNALAMNFRDYGVSHADDLFHIFELPFFGWTEDDDVQIVEALSNMIYSFSTTGVPKLLPNSPQWQPVAPGVPELNYMEITGPDALQMKSKADLGYSSFWDSLGFLENENFKKNSID